MSTVLEPVVEPRVVEVEPNKIQRILTRAAEIVENGWCRGYLAVNGEGLECEVADEEAKRFCMFGAYYRARWEMFGEDPNKLDELNLESLGLDAGWNDSLHDDGAPLVAERLREIALAL